MSETTYLEPQTKKKFRAKELAIFLGIGISTVWRYAKQNRIQAYKISGGVTVFDIDEVLKDLGISGGTK